MNPDPEVRAIRRKIAERNPCGYEETLLEIIADLESRLQYVQGEPWAPGDGTEVKCETAGNIVNDLTIDCGLHWCGHIEKGVAFSFGRLGGWILEYEHLKAAYELATRIRERARISNGG
jgi:hypothetical protein